MFIIKIEKWFVLTLLIVDFVYNQENNNCVCVPFYLCVNGTINTNGEGIIDIRFGPDDGPCDSYLDTCCQKNNVIPATRAPPPLPSRTDCGYRNPDGVGFKVVGDGDNEAQFGEFPWMTAVFRKGKADQKHLFRCGGSLIHPEVVLTAAHCVKGEGDDFTVRAGEWDSQTTREVFQHQNRHVSSLVIHPRFNRENLQNDVALLFLDEPMEPAAHVNSVCLPPPGLVASGSGCFVTGWGRAKFEEGKQYQTILKEVRLPIVPRGACQSAFRKTRLGRFFKLHRSFICAGGEEGVDACTGDGGGPLVCPIQGEEERYQQVGIVAWGIGCGSKGVPGAYANVAHFRGWIDQQMKNKKLVLSNHNFVVNLRTED